MTNKRKIIAGITAAVLVVGAGIAYAAWTVSGSGTGTAKAATAASITLNTPASTTGDLYPGFTGGDLSFDVANPNNFPVVITGLTTGAITSDNGLCDDTNITLDDLSTGLSITVSANATAESVTIPDVVSMVNNAADACQGATFTVQIPSVTAASAA